MTRQERYEDFDDGWQSGRRQAYTGHEVEILPLTAWMKEHDIPEGYGFITCVKGGERQQVRNFVEKAGKAIGLPVTIQPEYLLFGSPNHDELYLHPFSPTTDGYWNDWLDLSGGGTMSIPDLKKFAAEHDPNGDYGLLDYVNSIIHEPSKHKARVKSSPRVRGK